MSKDGNYLYISNHGSEEVRKLNLNTYKSTVAKVGKEPRTMILSDDEKFLFVTNYKSNTVSCVDTKTMKEIFTKKTGETPVGIDILNDEIWLTNYKESSLYIYQIKQ